MASEPGGMASRTKIGLFCDFRLRLWMIFVSTTPFLYYEHAANYYLVTLEGANDKLLVRDGAMELGSPVVMYRLQIHLI